MAVDSQTHIEKRFRGQPDIKITGSNVESEADNGDQGALLLEFHDDAVDLVLARLGLDLHVFGLGGKRHFAERQVAVDAGGDLGGVGRARLGGG